MKTQTSTLKTLSLASLLLGAQSLVGCMNATESTDATELDGQSAFISSEVDQMGQSLGGLPDAALGKSGAIAADTITGELIIERYAFHDDCQCLVRTAEYSGSRGFERTRVDSVTLLDSAGGVLHFWERSKIAKIIHKRHVTRNKGSHDIDVHFNTEATFKLDNGVLVGVWNGTMTGTFDGEEFKSGTVSNVTREYKNGRFGFPIAGSVTVTRPLRIYSIEFLGSGDAKATITHRRTGKVTVITVDRNYQEKPSV